MLDGKEWAVGALNASKLSYDQNEMNQTSYM